MPDDDIKIHDPASRAKDKQYTESDVEQALRKAQPGDWDQLLSWLRERGDEDRRLTPGEVKHMVQDFSRLKEQGKPFTPDPHQLYQEARAG
jgi:hypothetical protein